MDHTRFLRAEAIWARAPRPEYHDIVGFSAQLPAQEGKTLRIAASSVYRVWVDGVFLAYGPSRAGKGFFRVDEWKIPDGAKVLAIEVVDYGVNAFSAMKHPGFICAEVVVAGEAKLWTSASGRMFLAQNVPGRLRKVPRFSFQRPFSEAYHLKDSKTPWYLSEAKIPVQKVDIKDFAPARASLPHFCVVSPVSHVSVGTVSAKANVVERKDRSLTDIGPQMLGCPEKELEAAPVLELQHFQIAHRPEPSACAESYSIGTNQSRVFSLGTNLSGFVGIRIRCEKKTRVYLAFDEILSGDQVDFFRLGCGYVIRLDLEPGTHEFESAEPYTFRYEEVIVTEGECEISHLTLREIACPDTDRAQFACSDPRLNRIFRAAVQTFRQNAVDIFMDCPSRERAGWLCDSFFTARTAQVLTGHTNIEHDFLENFARATDFPDIPKGMFPMCYPSDHYDKTFIPQWAMWLVIQLREYKHRGEHSLVEQFRPRLRGLLKFLQGYRNFDGLLEKLPSWNFIEWSQANNWVQDVNYPTNMLFAGALEAFAELLEEPALATEAARVHRVIHEQSFDGTFYRDHALRKDGRLEVQANCSEVAQYYAFFFRTADEQTHPDLWRKLLTEFGPGRRAKNLHPQVAFANAFIGMYLRLEILSRAGRTAQVCDEIVGYFDGMANLTGTLWENDSTAASCNHGFASYVAVWLVENALGLRFNPDGSVKSRKIPENSLAWASGRLPTKAGMVAHEWERSKPAG
ncbi:MAG: hypothetical protein ACOYON_14810 [Fimbriimonas sp.]